MQHERHNHIRAQAINALELTKGFTPEQRECFSNSLKTVEEFSGYILELTSNQHPESIGWVKATKENMRRSAILRDSVLPENNIHQWSTRAWDDKGVLFTNKVSKDWWELEILDESGQSKEGADVDKPGLRETIEDIILSAGKHNQEQCTEIADAILREAGQSKEGNKQIDRDWITGALVQFALLYHLSENKDISNDACEYLNDKLKEADIDYVLCEEEKEGNKENDAVLFGDWLRTQRADVFYGSPTTYQLYNEYKK
jgi:hypothetical protein